ncbi:MAG: phosphoribosyltransferase [Chloroflexota bacterium]
MTTYEAFVLMPFGENNEYSEGSIESDYIYREIIEPGVKEAANQLNQKIKNDSPDDSVQINITREVDRNQTGSITSSIVRNITKADVVVVDITGRNPNVFLELGIRYALRSKVTVLMAQAGTQIPFDIKVYRYIEYNHFKPSDARKKITNAICEGLSDNHSSDSIVFDALPSLSVSIPGIAESFGAEAVSKNTTMSWDDYMNRIEETCKYLEIAVREYRFLPDAVIGITNGGLIAADLIGKRVYAGRDTPVLSLWAMRHVVMEESAFWYFDNEYNDSMINAIQSLASKKTQEGDITILLIDDHMGTGSTARQAVAYIKNRIGERARVTFIPIVSRRLDNIGVVEEFLPYSCKDREGKSIFNITKDEFLARLNTKAFYFPYLNKQVNFGSGG